MWESPQKKGIFALFLHKGAGPSMGLLKHALAILLALIAPHGLTQRIGFGGRGYLIPLPTWTHSTPGPVLCPSCPKRVTVASGNGSYQVVLCQVLLMQEGVLGVYWQAHATGASLMAFLQHRCWLYECTARAGPSRPIVVLLLACSNL